MSTRWVRMTVGALGAVALGASVLVGVGPATQAADGTLTFIPTEGTGQDGFSVQTSAGCANSDATHFIIKMTGLGLEEENNVTGVTELSAIGATPTQTAAMTSPISKILDTVKAENGGVLPNGGYTLSFICRPKLSTTPLSTFTGMITVTNGAGGSISWKEGFTPTPSPIVNTVRPKVTGKKGVGQTLTVSRGKWSPRPTSYAYAWRLGSKVVGTASTLTVTKKMKGKTLRVTVTAVKDGFTSGKASVSVAIP